MKITRSDGYQVVEILALCQIRPWLRRTSSRASQNICFRCQDSAATPVPYRPSHGWPASTHQLWQFPGCECSLCRSATENKMPAYVVKHNSCNQLSSAVLVTIKKLKPSFFEKPKKPDSKVFICH